jgi:hypothetical protein
MGQEKLFDDKKTEDENLVRFSRLNSFPTTSYLMESKIIATPSCFQDLLDQHNTVYVFY